MFDTRPTSSRLAALALVLPLISCTKEAGNEMNETGATHAGAALSLRPEDRSMHEHMVERATRPRSEDHVPMIKLALSSFEQASTLLNTNAGGHDAIGFWHTSSEFSKCREQLEQTLIELHLYLLSNRGSDFISNNATFSQDVSNVIESIPVTLDSLRSNPTLGQADVVRFSTPKAYDDLRALQSILTTLVYDCTK